MPDLQNSHLPVTPVSRDLVVGNLRFRLDCYGIKFVVSKVGEGYDAHIRSLDRKLQLNPAGKGNTMLQTILIILLVLFLLGALPSWPYSAHWGYYPRGGMGYALMFLLPFIFFVIVYLH